MECHELFVIFFYVRLDLLGVREGLMRVAEGLIKQRTDLQGCLPNRDIETQGSMTNMY